MRGLHRKWVARSVSRPLRGSEKGDLGVLRLQEYARSYLVAWETLLPEITKMTASQRKFRLSNERFLSDSN